jgi:ABC-type multidrug transport system ATPase subunit
VTVTDTAAQAPAGAAASPAIEARMVSRSFGAKEALREVSLAVMPGRIHALLGPNGAGKTTLLRILTGLTGPDSGEVRVLGSGAGDLMSRRARSVIGLVPSGDRTFYMRLSGLENLRFFARMHGLSTKDALARSWELLRDVDLEDAARQPMGTYSHGMQKRLSVARALLMSPPILFVDEATHDLDPQAAHRVQELVSAARDRGTAVMWATQRIDEIRGFADRVTVLREGTVRFEGTVPQLMAVTIARRYLVHLRGQGDVLGTASAALEGLGGVALSSDADGEHFVVALREEVVLGRAVAALDAAGLAVLTCREERSEIEAAFLFLTAEGTANEEGER